MGVVIDSLLNAIAEPTRLPPCPAMIAQSGQQARRANHGSMYDCGAMSGLVPIEAVIVSYFMRRGHVPTYDTLGQVEHGDRRFAGSTAAPPRRSGGD